MPEWQEQFDVSGSVPTVDTSLVSRQAHERTNRDGHTGESESLGMGLQVSRGVHSEMSPEDAGGTRPSLAASVLQKTRQPAELVATLLAVAVSWAVFDGFTRPVETRSTTWAGVSAWTAAIEAQLGTERHALAKQRASWDKILDDLGGDPTSRDWTSF